MAQCVVCSTEIKDEARFCPACGAEQPRAQTAGTSDDPLMGKVVARKFKIEKPEDVAGKKMRTMQVQLHLDAWNAVGANPTPMPFPEVMNALQTGTIDYFDSIGSSYWDLKAYEVAPHMSVLGHIYAIFTVAVSEQWWQRQTPEHRKVMESAFQELAPFEHHLITYYNALGPDKAAKAGATITYVKDKTAWQAKMKPLWDKWAAGVPDGKALYEEILATK